LLLQTLLLYGASFSNKHGKKPTKKLGNTAIGKIADTGKKTDFSLKQ